MIHLITLERSLIKREFCFGLRRKKHKWANSLKWHEENNLEALEEERKVLKNLKHWPLIYTGRVRDFMQRLPIWKAKPVLFMDIFV